MPAWAGHKKRERPALIGIRAQYRRRGDAGDRHSDIIELDPLGGVSLFDQVNKGSGEKLVTGGTASGRVAWNVTCYFGVELSYNFMVNNVRLVTPIATGLPTYTCGQQIHDPALKIIYNIAPRGSRFQHYVTTGKGIDLHSSAREPSGHALTYSWKMNGTPQTGNTADFSFTPNSPGDFKTEVTVADTTNPARTVTAGPITLTVQEYTKPQVTNATATAGSLASAADTNETHTAGLSEQATGSACGGNLTYKWTVSEGSLANDGSAGATFDSSSFNSEGGGQGQTKTATAILTVTDETGQTVSQTASIGVSGRPQSKRLSDIVFSGSQASVNDCGKRSLIDRAAPQAGNTYNVVLVGQRAKKKNRGGGETGIGRAELRGRHSTNSSRSHATAMLSAGHGACGNLDPAQIKIEGGDDRFRIDTRSGTTWHLEASNRGRHESGRLSEAEQWLSPFAKCYDATSSQELILIN